MALPLISIITPSFNQGIYLEETIHSIISQNYPALEYIVIDGGSTDNSKDIIKKYEKQITYSVSEKDKGQSDAINKGFRKATGEIIAWLNSDDVYFPDTIQTVAHIFLNNPELDLIYGDVEQFYETGKTEYYKVNDFEPLDFLSRVSIHQPSVFWRRKVLEEVGLLDENLHYLMDYDLWMRIFFNYKTFKIDKLLSRFRIHSKSKTNNKAPGLYLDYRKVFSRFINSYPYNQNIEILKILRIYDNERDIHYTYKQQLPEDILNKAFINYIRNCIIQEYTWGNTKRVNQLIFHKQSPLKIKNNLLLLIKNNLGVGFLKNKWKN